MIPSAANPPPPSPAGRRPSRPTSGPRPGRRCLPGLHRCEPCVRGMPWTDASWAHVNMLINCVAYQNGTKLADISVEAISDYVGRPDCFVWVALFDPTDEELALMAEEFGLHE